MSIAAASPPGMTAAYLLAKEGVKAAVFDSQLRVGSGILLSGKRAAELVYISYRKIELEGFYKVLDEYIHREENMSIEEKILNSSRTIAVVGLSPKPERPSYRVASYLKESGYKIIPVNPKAGEILGETCYPRLSSIPEPVDVVDIFRRSEGMPPIVEEAIKIGAKAVWAQEGVIHEEAASRAKGAGLLVVMDRCMLKEHQKLHSRGNSR